MVLLVAASSLLAVSCGSKKEPVFDSELIVGKWVSGTEFYRYDDDGRGVTWDTSDDVQEEEAQPFTWSYNPNSNHLTLIHEMEMGGVVPKTYIIMQLNDNILQYKDLTEHPKTYTYFRVIENEKW